MSLIGIENSKSKGIPKLGSNILSLSIVLIKCLPCEKVISESFLTNFKDPFSYLKGKLMSTIFEFLPETFRQDPEQKEIISALVHQIEIDIESWLTDLENYYFNYLEPKTAKSDWLDSLARWAGWNHNFWDSRWEITIKRDLIINSEFILQNRGNRDVITFLFKIFKIDAKIKSPNGFILRVTKFPGSLNRSHLSFIIEMNSKYIPGSFEYEMIKKILKFFAPCWCEFLVNYPQ